MLKNWSDHSESINYEVALEVLGQSMQPFVQALHDEKQKEQPSQSLS